MNEAIVTRIAKRTGRRRASIAKIACFWKIGAADAAELVLAVESRQSRPCTAASAEPKAPCRESQLDPPLVQAVH
jgi:hypothetical protein